MLVSKRRTAISLAVLMLAAVVLLRIGASHDLGRSALDRFADQPYGFALAPETPPFFLTWSTGDGQAFMSIAADLNGSDFSTGLGYQSYRMSRIGLSLLARLLVLGKISLLPHGLAAASFTAYCGLLVLAVRLTDELGLRALLLGLSPAAMIGTVFDSAEGLGTLLLVAGLTASTHYRAMIAGALLGVTRPSYGTAILASRAGMSVPAATVAAGLALQVLLATTFGIPFAGSAGNIVMPLRGYLETLPTMRPSIMASAAVVLLMAVSLILNALDRGYLTPYRIAAGLSALLALSVGPSTFVGPMSPLRVSGALVVLIVLAPMFRSDSRSAVVATGRNASAELGALATHD